MSGRWPLFAALVLFCACQSAVGCPAGKLSLWSMESARAKVYLMGSVHALTPDHYPLAPEFESIFQESDTLAVEVNLNEVSPQQMQILLMDFGYYQEGDLRSHLSAETLVPLEDFLLVNQQQLDPYLQMKPWLVSLQISSLMLRSAGYDPQLGVDRYFLEKARGIKPVLELESLEQQVKMLADEPHWLQERALRSELQNMTALNGELDSLVSAWLAGDSEGMHELALDSVSQEPELRQRLIRLLDGRNQNMAETIRGYLNQEGIYLVIVGALHMGGERGIVKLLAEQHTVRQIDRCDIH